MSSKKDVIIIGGGVTGCSIAYHLGKKGVTSLIIERESIGARASGKAWAMIVYPPALLSFERVKESLFAAPAEQGLKRWVELYWAGYYRMPDIAMEIKEKGGIDIEYDKTPCTAVIFKEKQIAPLKRAVQFQRENGGYETEYSELEDLQKIFPRINPDIKGGITYPIGQVEPYKYTLGLAQAAEKMGSDVKQGEVVGLGAKGSRITSVKLASGAEIEADTVVLTMGPWTGQGASWLGIDIPMDPQLEQCLRVEVPQGQALPAHALQHELTCVFPKANGEVIIGITERPDPRDPDAPIVLTEEVKMEMIAEGLKLLPELENAKIIEHRGDLMAWAPGPVHNRPVLGRLPEWDNAYIAGRIAFGMCMSAGVGQAMAEYIVAGRPPVGLARAMQILSPASS